MGKFLICSLICIFFATAGAQERPLLVGLAAVEPFVIEKDGQLSGLDHAFLKELMERAKTPATFTAWPMKRFVSYGTDGRFDVALDQFDRESLRKYYSLHPTPFAIHALLISRQKEFKIHKKKKQIIGHPRGIECSVFNKDQLKGVDFFEWDHIEQGILQLREKRIHALCIDLESFHYSFDRMSKNEKFEVFYHPEFSFDYKLSVYLKKTIAPEQKNRILQVLRQMEQENRHYRKDKYLK